MVINIIYFFIVFLSLLSNVDARVFTPRRYGQIMTTGKGKMMKILITPVVIHDVHLDGSAVCGLVDCSSGEVLTIVVAEAAVVVVVAVTTVIAVVVVEVTAAVRRTYNTPVRRSGTLPPPTEFAFDDYDAIPIGRSRRRHTSAQRVCIVSVDGGYGEHDVYTILI